MEAKDNSYVVLLSGGLDSVVNLHEAHKTGKVVRALTFNYGQRAFPRESQAAKYFCDKLDLPLEIIELPWLMRMTNTALVQKDQKLPTLKNLDDMKEAGESAKAVWVPNRNGVFLNIAATFAESLKAKYVVPGFNKEEAATFPDNSEGYMKALDGAFSYSTMSGVKVFCFTTHLDKIGMVKRARTLAIDLTKVWSCYENGNAPCGRCESCQRTLRALNGVGR